MQSQNPYRILGVSEGASLAECKSAYKKRMRERHPDFGKSEDDIKQREIDSKLLNEAMSIIAQRFKSGVKPVSRQTTFTHKDLFTFM